MFHEITDTQLKRRRTRLAVLVGVVVLLVVAVCLAFTTVQANAREQGALALHDSIVNAAKQCCAIEGTYPSSLEHLEKNYGLSINHNDYLVSYESFADNIMPTVVVTPR